MDVRRANNGKFYTEQEFLDWYGLRSKREWKNAGTQEPGATGFDPVAQQLAGPRSHLAPPPGLVLPVLDPVAQAQRAATMLSKNVETARVQPDTKAIQAPPCECLLGCTYPSEDGTPFCLFCREGPRACCCPCAGCDPTTDDERWLSPAGLDKLD